jgi:hypothetical protein
VLTPAWAERPALEQDYFVFSSVRNPFDRLVSSWKYLKSTRGRPLEEVLADPPSEGHDHRHFTRPQAAILRDAQTGNLIVHDLIRFESLHSDYNRINKHLGRRACRLTHVNATRRNRQWRPYFTSTARCLAETMFHEDLELFDYAF